MYTYQCQHLQKLSVGVLTPLHIAIGIQTRHIVVGMLPKGKYSCYKLVVVMYPTNRICSQGDTTHTLSMHFIPLT